MSPPASPEPRTATQRTCTERALHAARQVKHRLYLRRKYWFYSLRHLEPVRDAYQRRFPRPFDLDRYRGSFLAGVDPEPTPAMAVEVPRVIHCLWTGTNPMSETRRASLETIRATQAGIPVRLITPDTLDDYVRPDAPVHPAYKYLSNVHRSDYLRAYLLHHHGGGYIDIKRPHHHWGPVFDEVDRRGSWIAGYPEVVYRLIPRPQPFWKDLQRVSSLMTGQGAFIARAYSPFTTAWLNEVHARLDAKAPLLERAPGNAYGTNPGYPLGWTEILAEVTEPLEYMMSEHVLRDRRLSISTRNYR